MLSLVYVALTASNSSSDMPQVEKARCKSLPRISEAPNALHWGVLLLLKPLTFSYDRVDLGIRWLCSWQHLIARASMAVATLRPTTLMVDCRLLAVN